MDNNIEQLIKETLINNNKNYKNNNNNNNEMNNSNNTTPRLIEEEDDNSYEIEKLLQDIQNSCLSQYDKDKLLQSLYYSHGGGSNIDYFRQQLNNTIKDYNMNEKIYKAEQLLKKMNKNLETKTNNLNKIENDITDIKSNLLHTTINKTEYNQVQIVFESTIEKIKSEFVKQRIQNTLH